MLERCDSRQLSFCLFRNLNQILVTDGVMNNSCVFLFVNSIQSLLLISSKHCPWLHFGAIAHHKTFRPLNILSFLPFICTNLDPESSIKNFPLSLFWIFVSALFIRKICPGMIYQVFLCLDLLIRKVKAIYSNTLFFP